MKQKIKRIFIQWRIGIVFYLFRAFGWILNIIVWLIELSPIFFVPLLSIMCILAIQIGIWKLFAEYIAFDNQDLIASYLISLITLLTFAYRSNQIVTFFFKLLTTFEPKSFDKWKLKWIDKALRVVFLDEEHMKFRLL